MPTLPIKITKHWFGYVLIFLAGAGVIGLTWAGISSILNQPGIDNNLAFGLAALIIGVTVLITIVQMYVYSLSYIELNSNGVVFKNWITLFVSSDQVFEWVRVTKVSVAKGGIFGQVLNYGTLALGTSDGSKLVHMKMIPNIEYWQDVIESKADEATIDGTAP